MAGIPTPLAWKRGTFKVWISESHREKDLKEIEVEGPTSGPFGIFRGDSRGPAPKDRPYFSVIHIPTGRSLSLPGRRRECEAFAAEVSPLQIPWQETDPYKVILGSPDQQKFQKIRARYGAEH